MHTHERSAFERMIRRACSIEAQTGWLQLHATRRSRSRAESVWNVDVACMRENERKRTRTTRREDSWLCARPIGPLRASALHPAVACLSPCLSDLNKYSATHCLRYAIGGEIDSRLRTHIDLSFCFFRFLFSRHIEIAPDRPADAGFAPHRQESAPLTIMFLEVGHPRINRLPEVR